MNKDRIIENFIEMVQIHSPSKREGKYTAYLIDLFTELGGEIYLDEEYKKMGGDAPSVFIKFKGNKEGEGITLSAHTDVIEPNLDVKPVVEGNIIKTDGRTTLGGDDKAGVAGIIETIRTIKEKNLPHPDIFIILTPGEELGLVGAKSINWSAVPEKFRPAKNMVVLDGAGKTGSVGHSAPANHNFTIELTGKKAHAGIEPEIGLNAIHLASKAVAKMRIGRINEQTTSNLGVMQADSPLNVVPDFCSLSGEVRSQSEEEVLELLKEYEEICQETCEEFGGSYNFRQIRNYPALKPTDGLKFAREFAAVYESLGVPSELKVEGGGSDGNIFAGEGFNCIIVGIGSHEMHTTNEYLEISELHKTTQAVIKYITEKEEGDRR